MLTCKRQRSLKLWNACPTVWANEGRRAKRNCLSLLREITVTSKPWREGKKWDAIRHFSPSLSHSAFLSTFSSQHTDTRLCASTRFQSASLKKPMCFLSAERKEWELWFAFLPCFSVSSQADDCLHNEHFDPRMRRTAYNTGRHICMGVALPSSLSYLLCLFVFYWLVGLPCR